MESRPESISPKEDLTIHQTKAQIFLRFLKFGLLAWGGPVAQIAMIKQELVEEEKWISTERFNRALSVYQVLPGPEAHELCVYFGMLAGGRWGGFLAGLGFMLPGFLFMLLFTWIYLQFGIKSPALQAVFTGFQVAVIALIFTAVYRIGKHALINKKLFIIGISSFIAYFFGITFFIALPLAGLAYVLWMKGKTVLTALIGIALVVSCVILFTPEIFKLQTIVSTSISTGTASQTSLIVVFFTGLKGGLLTFGGAYTVIPFIQQDAVAHYGWMSNQQFLDGIALSGILPAPLIIFSTFVGYFGGGWLGAIIMTVAIFLPAFAFTLIGHNLMEKIIHNTALHNFLDGVTAGVIGLIALTAMQLFRTTVTDLLTVVIFAVSLFVLYRFKAKLTPVFVILGAGLISFLCLNVVNAQPTTQYNSLKLIETIPLPNVSGRIDHFSFDSKHQIIFIAALGNNTVEAVDLKNKKIIHSIKDLHDPQGVAFIPESNSLFVTNGDNGECDVFNTGSFKKIGSIKLSGDADNVRYDATKKKIYVGYGDGGIAIIDATNFKLINEIKLSGHPESFQLDKAADKIYVNVPDEKQIEVIDLGKNIVAGKWKMTEATSNFPMCLDEATHHLFIGCRHSAKLLVIDSQTGKTISSFEIDSDVDDIFYNSIAKEIYLSCGEGYIDVFKQADSDTYTASGKISTHPGARTSLFIPELNQLIVASPSGFNGNASLLIFEVK